VADDLPQYKAWLLRQPCACAPCIAAVVVHHHTNGQTHAPDAAPPKALGGKRGKSQRASDYYGLPICHAHHGQLHDLRGFFKGWSGDELRAWQDQQVRYHRERFEAELEGREAPAAPERRAGKPAMRGADWWAAGANAERGTIARMLRRAAAQARLLPDAAAALNDQAQLLEEIAEPLAPRPTTPRPGGPS
jgi:hypothetical protein